MNSKLAGIRHVRQVDDDTYVIDMAKKCGVFDGMSEAAITGGIRHGLVSQRVTTDLGVVEFTLWFGKDPPEDNGWMALIIRFEDYASKDACMDALDTASALVHRVATN